MAGCGGSRGGKLALLLLARKHLELVEVDLQRHYRVDVRDWFRPGRGRSKLTSRRLAVLIKHLPKDASVFWEEVADRDLLSREGAILADIFGALTKQAHPVTTARADQKKQLERQARKRRIENREKRNMRRAKLRAMRPEKVQPA